MDAIMMQPAACVCRSEDRGYLNSAFTFGRVAQRERASAFEAEGCRVEPRRGHPSRIQTCSPPTPSHIRPILSVGACQERSGTLLSSAMVGQRRRAGPDQLSGLCL
jgi:hypothetical protein